MFRKLCFSYVLIICHLQTAAAKPVGKVTGNRDFECSINNTHVAYPNGRLGFGATINVLTSPSCSLVYQTIPVDETMAGSPLYVEVHGVPGSQPNVSLEDQSGNAVPYHVLARSDALVVVRVEPPLAQGSWTAKLGTLTGPCTVSAFARTSLTVASGVIYVPNRDFPGPVARPDDPFTWILAAPSQKGARLTSMAIRRDGKIYASYQAIPRPFCSYSFAFGTHSFPKPEDGGMALLDVEEGTWELAFGGHAASGQFFERTHRLVVL